MKTNLNINSISDSGKKVSKNITNINAAKSNAVLEEFAKKINAFTTERYVNAERVDRSDTSEPDQTPPEPTPEKEKASMTAKGDWVFNEQFAYRVIAYIGDATHIFLQSDDGVGSVEKYGDFLQLTFIATVSDGSTYPDYDNLPFSITLYAPETDNFQATTLTLTHEAKS